MSQTVIPYGLRSVYNKQDFTEAEFSQELQRVHTETSQDRVWLDQYELETYETDSDILQASDRGRLERFVSGAGFLAIDRLAYWDASRSDSTHEYYYSPPFVHPQAAKLGRLVAGKWQAEMGAGRLLSLTSMIRSNQYQKNLANQTRKLTIGEQGKKSSHQAGIALDIDGCGIVEQGDDVKYRKINPRNPGYQAGLVDESRIVLLDILKPLHADGIINLVEELPGTQEHCFHICVNPGADI